MARLIDADANREEFKKILYRTLNDCSITTKKKFNLIITAFDDMPTTFNVEKVVEELEEEKQRLRNLKNNCIALCDSEVIAIEEGAYNYAIDIVRKGGV